ncbi:hypothetical protein ACP0HM_13065 [Escherichia coli]
MLNDISLDIPSGQMVALLGAVRFRENHAAAHYRRAGASNQRAYSLPRHRREPPART